MAQPLTIQEARQALAAVPRRVQTKTITLANRAIAKDAKKVAVRKWRSNKSRGGGTIKPSVAQSVVFRRASSKDAQVGLRYSRYPYAAGVEFGAIQYKQFQPWVGNRFTGVERPGYVLGETIAERQDEWEATFGDLVLEAFEDAIDAVTKSYRRKADRAG